MQVKRRNGKLFSIRLPTLHVFRGKYWCFGLLVTCTWALFSYTSKPAGLGWIFAGQAHLCWVQKQTLDVATSPACSPCVGLLVHLLTIFLFDILFFFSTRWNCINVCLQVWRVKDSIKRLSHNAHLQTSFCGRSGLPAEKWTVHFRRLLSREGAGCLPEMEELEDFSRKLILHLVLAS